MEHVSIGLDIATALSILTAVIMFIRNSVKSQELERTERRKETVQKYVYLVADKLNDDLVKLNTEICNIVELIQEEQMIQNLNPYKNLVDGMCFLFKIRLEPLGAAYGDGGRFAALASAFEKEQLDNIMTLFDFTKGERSDEEWDFHEVMNAPVVTTEKYITKLMVAGEEYINTL